MFVHGDVLLIGCGIFCCCLLLHILLWRIRHPRNHAIALLGVFFIPGVALVFLVLVLCPSVGLLDLFAIALLHVSLSCAYIQIYPASQAQSPSLKILVLVGAAMPGGLTETELRAQFNSDDLFMARVRDLLEAQLARQDGDKLILTPKGRRMVMPFIMLRTLVGLSAGRG